MADWYLEHGFTGYPTNYGTTPASSASLPQDGDGKAKGTGTTPAVASASWDLTSSSVAGTNTTVIMGATVSNVAASSGATLASNLATAINASTAVVTTTTGNITSPYLRGLCWATASGATLTVYTKIASADLNQSANASCTMAAGTGWTGAPANANFTGGVSGPWGTPWNLSTLTIPASASVSAAATYGGFSATMMGAPAAGDVVHVRTGRANADIIFDVGSAGTNTAAFRSSSSAGNPVEYRFDNGVVWNDGQSNGIFTIRKNGTTNDWIVNAGGFVWLHGQMKTGTDVVSGGQVNFRFSVTSNISPYKLKLNFGGAISGSIPIGQPVIEGFETHDTTAAGTNINMGPAGAHKPMHNPTIFRNCRFAHMGSGAGAFGVDSVYGYNFDIYDSLFAYGNATYSSAILATSTKNHVVRLFRPKFTGGDGGHHVLMGGVGGTGGNTYVLTIEDPVDMGQFLPSDSAASLLGRVSYSSAMDGASDLSQTQTIVSSRGDRMFLYDSPRRLLEWRSASFPTTGISVLPDGTPWSVRFSVAPSSVVAGCNKFNPQRGIKQIVSNSLGNDDLTLTVRFLVDNKFVDGTNVYTPAANEWWIEGTYVANDNTVKVFTTQGTAPASDTTTWSSLSFSPFAGAAHTYTRWKCSTNLVNVKADSEIQVQLMCAVQPLSLAEWSFIDPQPGLAAT